MSEYTGASPSHPPFDKLDHTGTLFEDLAEGQASGARQLGSRAVRRVATVVSHPPTTTELKARHHPHEDTEEPRDDAYRELGGNQSVYDDRLPLFDQLADDFEPWMTDIHIAVNRLALHEIASDTIMRMTKADQRLLAMHVDALLERIATAHRLIGAADGNVSAYGFLEKRYGSRRTPEELIAYMPTLERLREAINERHIMGALHRAAPEVFANSREVRNKRYNAYLRRRQGPIDVGYDSSGKLRVQEAPLRK